jgi:hypothetical protein
MLYRVTGPAKIKDKFTGVGGNVSRQTVKFQCVIPPATAEDAQGIALPVISNGRVSRLGEV